MYRNYLYDNYIYCQVNYKGLLADSVKMRVRGDSSRKYSKKSLKLKFGKSKSLPDGVTTLNLNAAASDYSNFREALASYVINKSGYPAIVTVPVVVYINDACKGVFMNVENLDKRFLLKREFSASTNLYKAKRDSACLGIYDNVCSYWEKKINGSDTLFDDLSLLIKALDTVSNSNYFSFAKNTFDYERMVHIISINMLIGNFSTYYHNYFMNHDLLTQKWTMFHWDLDNTFYLEDIETLYQNGNYSDATDGEMASNPFFERAISNTIILKDIQKKTSEIVHSVFNNDFLNPFIDSMAGNIYPLLENCNNAIHEEPEWKTEIENIKKFIGFRYQKLKYQFEHAPLSFRLNKSKKYENTIVLSWAKSIDPDNGKVTYDLAYSLLSSFDSKYTTVIKEISDTFFSIDAKSLKSGKYFWKVVARDGEFAIPGFDNRNTFVVD